MRNLFFCVVLVTLPSLVYAAPGDAIIEETVTVTATAAQRTALATFAAQIWDGSAANIRGISCYRPAPIAQPSFVECSVRGRKTMTPAAALAAVAAGTNSIQIVGVE